MSLILTLLLSFSMGELAPSGRLHIQLTNVEKVKGCVRLAVYDQAASFDKGEETVFNQVIKVKEASDIQVSVADLPYGHYAIALYHDLNDNGELDRNSLGIPKEPYAFSNNPSAKWRAPNFEESKFLFEKDQQETVLVLKRWKAH